MYQLLERCINHGARTRFVLLRDIVRCVAPSRPLPTQQNRTESDCCAVRLRFSACVGALSFALLASLSARRRLTVELAPENPNPTVTRTPNPQPFRELGDDAAAERKIREFGPRCRITEMRLFREQGCALLELANEDAAFDFRVLYSQERVGGKPVRADPVDGFPDETALEIAEEEEWEMDEEERRAAAAAGGWQIGALALPRLREGEGFCCRLLFADAESRCVLSLLVSISLLA